jgi:hypothetical protein
VTWFDTAIAYLVTDGRPWGWRTSGMTRIYDLGEPASPAPLEPTAESLRYPEIGRLDLPEARPRPRERGGTPSPGASDGVAPRTWHQGWFVRTRISEAPTSRIST